MHFRFKMQKFFSTIQQLSQDLVPPFFLGTELEPEMRFHFSRGILEFLRDFRLTSEQLRVIQLELEISKNEREPTPEEEEDLNAPIFDLEPGTTLTVAAEDFLGSIDTQFYQKFGPGPLIPVDGMSLADTALGLGDLLVTFFTEVEQLVNRENEVQIQLKDGRTAELTSDGDFMFRGSFERAQQLEEEGDIRKALEEYQLALMKLREPQLGECAAKISRWAAQLEEYALAESCETDPFWQGVYQLLDGRDIPQGSPSKELVTLRRVFREKDFPGFVSLARRLEMNDTQVSLMVRVKNLLKEQSDSVDREDGNVSEDE